MNNITGYLFWKKRIWSRPICGPSSGQKIIVILLVIEFQRYINTNPI